MEWHSWASNEEKVLIEKYSYKLEYKHYNLLLDLSNYYNEKEGDRIHHPNTERCYYELACMLYILIKARKKGGKLSMKITEEEKASNVKIDIIEHENINYLWKITNDQLWGNRHEDYMEVFGWEDRQSVLPEDITRGKKTMPEVDYNNWVASMDESYYINEPYKEDEIKTILKYEKAQMESFNIVMRERLSFYLNKVVNAFVKDGIFKAGYKPISTEDACFLYEYLCIIGITEDNELSRREKKDYIRFELMKLKNKNLHDEIKLLVP